MTSRKFRVAAAQIKSGPDVETNLKQAWLALRAASAQGAQLVVLPEASVLWFAGDLSPAAQPLDGPIADALRDMASKLGLSLVAGLFEPAEPGPFGPRVHNTVLVTGPAGEASYRKIHLFDAFDTQESRTVAAGREYVVTTIADGSGGSVSLGLATCYDLRFGEQFTELGSRGAELIAVPASWGAGPGKVEQWQVLTRARALDAQAWLVASGQAHQTNAANAPLGVGHSSVISPLGEVHGELGEEAGLLIGDIDLDQVAAVRQQIPVLQSRRDTGLS